jgi:ABC-type lipoprotein export system ATPase subunit
MISLSKYALDPIGQGRGIAPFDLDLRVGDVCFVDSDSPDDAILMLRGLATLSYPAAGAYRFHGDRLDFSDYRTLLPVKKKIGYISTDAAMLSNRTIKENLLLMRYYFENSLSLGFEERMVGLCFDFNIINELGRRPAEVNPMDLRFAIAVREIAKAPDVLLIDRPEDFISGSKRDVFQGVLKELIDDRLPIVLVSESRMLLGSYATRLIKIRKGKILEESVTAR